jgi:aerobic-type carbon monoxide dehydrogenase small subunit (CoxS/CutS family)/CO/xanthine dehydrogenase FAD-binding subunit
MLARGIRSYHRPNRIEKALELSAQGVIPLAGGTRLLAANAELPNVLDLGALGLDGFATQEDDLEIGAMVTLQDLIDSKRVHDATGGLLPAACHAHSASRMIRGAATLGGEAVFGAPDSDVVAALLALNAVFLVARTDEPLESPALRFLKKPAEDLAGGGILRAILIPAGVQGTALERVAVLPSAPTLVSVAVSVSCSADRCTRARIALTGLDGRPMRVPQAEARIEHKTADAAAIALAAEDVQKHARFRDDAHAPAAYRKSVAGVLVRRALTLAIERAKNGALAAPRRRPVLHRGQPIQPLDYFTSGRVELQLNGRSLQAEAEARTTLLELLRRQGAFGVKHGCETGECGACTVLLDGRPAPACMTLALRAQGRHVETVEGLGTPDSLHSLQQAFVDTGAVQCGYCTPALLLCAKALLAAIPDPSEEEVRDALAGALCRCTGYVKPVEAVLKAARGRE